LLADEALERRDPGFVLLEKIGGDSILIEVASLVLLTQIRIRFRQTS
jgi:hypothetical protein